VINSVTFTLGLAFLVVLFIKLAMTGIEAKTVAKTTAPMMELRTRLL